MIRTSACLRTPFGFHPRLREQSSIRLGQAPLLKLAALLLSALAARSEVVEIRPALVEADGGIGIEYRSAGMLVGRATESAPAGVEILLPGGRSAPVQFRTKNLRRGVIELGPAKVGALTLRLRLVQKTPSLVERTLEVRAESAQRFAVTLPLNLAIEGEFASFSGPEKAHQPRDGRYIFISGPGYGWKQWVSDGFYVSLGLADPEKTIESNGTVFWTRMDYEDNAQYCLIWAVLMKRAGGTVNEALVRKAYDFIRHLASKMVGKDFLSETDYARGGGRSPRGVSQIA